jgi:hypothetical protein
MREITFGITHRSKSSPVVSVLKIEGKFGHSLSVTLHRIGQFDESIRSSEQKTILHI